MRLRKPYGALWQARVCFAGSKYLHEVRARQTQPFRSGDPGVVFAVAAPI